MALHDLVTESELSCILDGIKDFLVETYQITGDEASRIATSGEALADDYLYDYSPYLEWLASIRQYIGDTFEQQSAKEIENECEETRRMVKDAAVWLAFECAKRYYNNSSFELARNRQGAGNSRCK
ncbi:hypothetical protein [Paenibacillus thalictri]|uniref:Uncharacterized protein n=1 Tax=Paenibacillus thalictri TaxID=2527873 RepID=A0A4Q9DJC5_9BACL|nr:hypothetical protein [Paenibacillus thalictri]TBL71533.1 hypothetical protein EYB31_29580 [Paenibacillus thalictri]